LAQEILARAYARYGGWERWRAVRRIDLTLAELSGPLPWMKGRRYTFHAPHRIEVHPHDRRTVFLNYPELDRNGVFADGAVWIEPSGPLKARFAAPVPSRDYHQTFAGISKYRLWQPLDALYFFGYALWHYHALPFAIAQARVISHARRTVSGQRTDAVVVEFPRSVHTHSPRQTFYFNQDGLIVRHDYVAKVVGAWASGAHECLDYRVVDGLPIAMRRQVWWRIGRTRLPIPVLRARFSAASVISR
jgi:hypothetical protein